MEPLTFLRRLPDGTLTPDSIDPATLPAAEMSGATRDAFMNRIEAEVTKWIYRAIEEAVEAFDEKLDELHYNKGLPEKWLNLVAEAEGEVFDDREVYHEAHVAIMDMLDDLPETDVAVMTLQAVRDADYYRS